MVRPISDFPFIREHVGSAHGIAARPRDWRRVAKEVMDRSAAFALLLFMTPLLVAIAAAVRTEGSGPILFRQARYGLNGRMFEILKFRSMKTGGGDESGALQALREDPRTTHVGRLLRKTSLDELPQLLNVLRGDMSLVGPRPHPVPLDDEYERLIEGYMGRYDVKPGITGWAQVHGHRGPIDSVEHMRSRVARDMDYIENWSLRFDLKILAMTILYGFLNKNAY